VLNSLERQSGTFTKRIAEVSLGEELKTHIES